MPSCMSEATFTPFGICQGFCRDPFHVFVPGYYHLGDSVPVLDGEILIGEVGQDDFYFAAVIGIDGSGRIEHGNAVFGGQSAARADLGFEADRQFNVQAGGDKDSAASLECYGFLKVRADIHPC